MRFVRPFDLDGLFHQHGAAFVQDHDIGRAVSLAGDDGEAAGLDRKVGDQRIADHDGGGAIGKLQDPGLVEVNEIGSAAMGRRGDGGKNDSRQEPMQRGLGRPGRARKTPSSILSETLRGFDSHRGRPPTGPLDCKLVNEVQIGAPASAALSAAGTLA